jgi:glutamate racemase
VVACNTATTNAIQILRDKYTVPFIGIEPAIKPAGLITKTKRIGILATKGTLNSELFENTSGTLNTDIEIIEKVGEGLVDLIENGHINSSEMHQLLSEYLKPMIESNIDALVLGCTHYPYLIPQIEEIIGNTIQIIDSGLAVAKQTKNILEKFDLLQTNDVTDNTYHHFYINTKSDVLKHLVALKNTSIFEKDF